LARVGTSGWTRRLKIPESAMGGEDIEIVLGNFSETLSR
jgi:hypothetical protein